MVFSGKRSVELLITEGDQVDLSRASYVEDLSATGMDEDRPGFYLTIDRASFRKPLDIVCKVLESRGYSLAFENILACFDSLVIGTRVRVSESPERPVRAKAFLPCLHFALPEKERVGFLLKKFYTEIEAYESEILHLRDRNSRPSAKDQREHLRRDLERLQAENKSLSEQIKALRKQLSEAARSQAHVTKALETQNLMPAQLLPAVIREFSLSERTVLVRSGRKQHTVPLALFQQLPKLGEPCLLNIQEDRIVAAYCYEQRGSPFTATLGEMLFVTEHYGKIRDKQRNIWIWRAIHDEEITQLRSLQRGSLLLLHTVDQTLVKLTSLQGSDQDRFAAQVQETITMFHLLHSQSPEQGAEPLPSGKDR